MSVDRRIVLNEELCQQLASNASLGDIQGLLVEGANPCGRLSSGNIVLASAVRGGRWEVVLCLVQAIEQFRHRFPTEECGVNTRDKYQRIALHYAAEIGCTELMCLLLGAGSNINAEDHENLTPLHLATGSGHFNAIVCLLRFGCNLNAKTDRCYEKITSLHISASGGFVEIVTLLLEKGAKVDPSDYKDQSPLYLAVCRGHIAVAQVLLEAGANVNSTQMNGYTPLMEAVMRRDLALVQLLLRYGATSTCSHYLLHQAIINKSEEIALLLIRTGFSLNNRNPQGWTCLQLACRYGNARIVEEILLHGADPNDAHSLSGETPLFCAIKGLNASSPPDEGMREDDFDVILHLLVKHGAELECRANVGSSPFLAHTPLALAFSTNRLEVGRKLLDYGANPNNPHSHVVEGLPALFWQFGPCAVLLVVAAGLEISSLSADSYLDALPHVGNDETVLRQFLDLFCSLRERQLSLKSTCRKLVRKRLQTNIFVNVKSSAPFQTFRDKVSILPVPEILKSYVGLQIF